MAEEAEKWLETYYDEGEFQIESMDGGDFIAKITHRSEFKVTDKKTNYSQEQIDNGEWPYEYEEYGQMNINEVESLK